MPTPSSPTITPSMIRTPRFFLCSDLNTCYSHLAKHAGESPDHSEACADSGSEAFIIGQLGPALKLKSAVTQFAFPKWFWRHSQEWLCHWQTESLPSNRETLR